MVEDNFSVTLEEINNWEKELRAVAGKYEAEGNDDYARMLYCASGLMYRFLIEKTKERQKNKFHYH